MQGIEQFQPARLKSARLMYDGLSRAALAEMINVAPSTLKSGKMALISLNMRHLKSFLIHYRFHIIGF